MDYELCISQIKQFFLAHTENYSDSEVLEIRLLGRAYVPGKVKTLLLEKNIKFINTKQLFFSKDELEKLICLMMYDDYFLIKNFKICYALNPRILKKILINKRSGYDSMETVRCVGFDFELVEHKNPTSKDLEDLQTYVDKFKLNVSMYGLVNPGVVLSGRGLHLLYYTIPQRITDGRKLWFKGFIEHLCEHFTNNRFRIDPLKDFTRVFSIPGSINHKVNRMVFQKRKPSVCAFMLKSREQRFDHPVLVEDTPTDIDKLLEWRILKTGTVPPGERHQLLVLPLKIWLAETKNPNWKDYEKIINALYKGSENFNPRQLTGGNYKYNSAACKKWISKNKKWIEDNNFEV